MEVGGDSVVDCEGGSMADVEVGRVADSGIGSGIGSGVGSEMDSAKDAEVNISTDSVMTGAVSTGSVATGYSAVEGSPMKRREVCSSSGAEEARGAKEISSEEEWEGKIEEISSVGRTGDEVNADSVPGGYVSGSVDVWQAAKKDIPKAAARQKRLADRMENSFLLL
ncbi:MAG: hypothetical protein II347_01955 [Lachnospiraceae bacterium]|nr:hypothetical protein [Lachnospiraceae bacterium]